jgi:ATP-dependent DNA helicase PIF1
MVIHENVLRLENNVLECSLLTETKIGDTIFNPRMSIIRKTINLPFKFKIKQFLMSIFISMTINKSKVTFLFVGLYLMRPVISHRSTKMSMILLPNTTINIMYKEVFEKLI